MRNAKKANRKEIRKSSSHPKKKRAGAKTKQQVTSRNWSTAKQRRSLTDQKAKMRLKLKKAPPRAP